MKKNLFRYPLMAALMCGLSMGFVACSDDDDNKDGNGNNNGTDTEVMNEDQTDEAIKAWAWVSVLTDETDQAADWAGKIYTATIGEPSPNNPETARLIYVSNLDEAKESFANIAGCKPEELSGKKVVSAGAYGSMEWNISAQGAANIATVDVNSSLLPRLQQIIYCTEEQAPDNAAEITGNCYYRLGDVIEDKDGYYWLCVQPSFYGKKNKDSYWVNLFNADPKNGEGVNTKKTPGIPEKNIYKKYNKKYNGNTILLPTCLKMDRKQIYNLSNLLYAVMDNKKYAELIEGSETGLAGISKQFFGPKYARVLFDDWNEADVFEHVLNCGRSSLNGKEFFNFFYYGYHWKVGSTAGVWLYNEHSYQKNYKGNLDDDDTLYEMKKAGYGFDITRYAGDPNQDDDCAVGNEKGMAPSAQFTQNNVYYVVRVATGKQLDKNYDPYKKMEGYYDIYNNNLTHKHEVGPETVVPEYSDLDVDDDDDEDDDDESFID